MTEPTPDGMMPVEEFCRINGASVKNVVLLIRDGTYAGRKIKKSWFIDRSELEKNSGRRTPSAERGAHSNANEEHQSVVVVDFKVPFVSMVGFFMKAAIAAIPALIVLGIIGVGLFLLFTQFISIQEWYVSGMSAAGISHVK